MAKRRLIVFVKAPRPGLVKTRLASSIGPEQAANAYRQLAEQLFQNLAPLAGVDLRFTPDDARSEIEPWLRPGWTLSPQGEGGLGERLNNAFLSAFQAGCDQVAIVGSDCPDVTGGDISAAWEKLGSHDAVFGPATDGGYWLVALRAPAPPLFDEIEWSTDRVLAQSLAAACNSHLSATLLEEKTDIDTLEEWTQWQSKNGL